MRKIVTAFVIVLGSLQMVMGQVAPGIEWQNTIGGKGDDKLKSMQQTDDGGYILGGYTESNISGDKTENNLDTICNPSCTTDYWIVKLYPDTITSINNIQQTTNNIQVFPNPFTESLTLTLSKGEGTANCKVQLFDVFGKEILSQTITTANSKLRTVNVPKGIYFLKLNVDGNVVTKKVVKM